MTPVIEQEQPQGEQDIFDAIGGEQPQTQNQPQLHQDSGKDVFDVLTATRFAVCAPKFLSTDIPNNTFMEGNKEPVDRVRAMRQWLRMVNVFKALDCEFYEIPATPGAQDATFCSNVAMCIEPYIILANMSAPGRAVEEEPARQYFQSLGYEVIQPPFAWEGYAETKPLNDKVYFGGYGHFSDIRAQQWIAQQTGVKVIPIREIDERMYHLDTCLMVLDEENVMVTKSGIHPDSLKEIGKVANLVFTPDSIAVTGVTNGVLIKNKKIYMSGTLMPEEKDYRKAQDFILDTMDIFGYTPVFLETDAIGPSGGALSCQSLPLTFLPNGH